ncbi:hypothetical protein A6V39_03070 [Candidatus Mycoplasma haematobovis]|uniref:DJ-1/PfpI domain-containing protein n=1 Tax=Candidatus Mycoplasma haematobovis TaxID=432608 RepID=A0A1A9QCT2_9MOLU|nr:DJ-1/PfpI family protein [Candidatus Mycoplasma haematobovis]OAL10392.1 hypothetical protein A6V39_03070 [Candidatus Mycoplasma haematobovis]
MQKQIRIAVIAPNNVEDMELIVPIDIWKRAKFIVDVMVYDVKSSFNLSYSMLKVTSGLNLKTVNMIQYDAIFLPGGPGYKSYLNPSSIERDDPDPKLHNSVKKFFDDPSKWLVAICAAPIPLLCILEEARNKDLSFTCYNDPNIIGDFRENWINKKVVVDKQVITAQNAGCAIDVALATVECLAGAELAQEIAKKLFIDYKGVHNYPILN